MGRQPPPPATRLRAEPSPHLPGLWVLGSTGGPVPSEGAVLIGVLPAAPGSRRRGLALAAEALRRGRRPLWLDPTRLGCPGSRRLERLDRWRGSWEVLAGRLPGALRSLPDGRLREPLARVGRELLGGLDPVIPLLATHPWVAALAAAREGSRLVLVPRAELPEVARYAREDGEARARRTEELRPPRLLLPAPPEGPDLRWGRRVIARLAPRVRAGEASLLLDTGGDHRVQRAWMEEVSRRGITGREMLSLAEAERLVERSLLVGDPRAEPAGASIVCVPRPLQAALLSGRLVRCADLLLARPGAGMGRPLPTLGLGPPDGTGSIIELGRLLDRPGRLRRAAEREVERARSGAFDGAGRALDALAPGPV